MNRFYKIIIILIELIISYIILFINIQLPCLIKKYLSLYCPACGLTRAFKSIFKLDLISAINYNYFSLIIFAFLVILNIYLIYDVITNKKKTNNLLNTLGRHYILITLLLIINTILNNIK